MLVGNEHPYETIRQARHERRVFGHHPHTCLGDCDWHALVMWNDPARLWAGSGERYRRRVINRRKRGL